MSEQVTRRNFIKGGLLATGVTAATAAALSPLRAMEDFPTFEQFFQQHYKKLSAEDLDKIMRRIEQDVQNRHGVKAYVSDPKPLDGVEFAYALNLGRCIGCRKCVYACMKENNLSRDPELQYIRVLKMKKGSIDIESSEHDFTEGTKPEGDYYFMPVQCHQCRNAPCVKVCPVGATWQEKDGVVVVDYDWCIGCRYCEAACPYFARRFNWKTPQVPEEEINPNMGYLSNRPRKKGVVEKCHFCLQRTRNGRIPACAEVCPTGSRKFGNLLDPESEISFILKSKRVYILKEDLGTMPRFYYYFDK